MCSKNDSDATYCSDVEEQIKTTCRRQKWKLENMPLRRSQRLSQISTAPLKFSWDNVRITNNGVLKVIGRKRVQAVTCSPDIFSVQDLLEEQELIGQLNNIWVNDHLNCPTKHVKSLKHQEDVPLDLAKKSKVLANKTSAGDLEKVNNGEETIENNDNINLFPKKKIGRPRKLKHSENANNIIKPPLIKDASVENSNKNKAPKQMLKIDHDINNSDLPPISSAKIKDSKGNSSSKKPDKIKFFPKKKLGRPIKLKCSENFNKPVINGVVVEHSRKNITPEHLLENIEIDFNNINKSLQISTAKIKDSNVNSFPRKPRRSTNKTGMFLSKTATLVATETQELLEDKFNQNMSSNVPKKCAVKRDKSSELLESNFCNASADLVINSEFKFEKKELNSSTYQKFRPISDPKINIQISVDNSIDFPKKKIKLSNEIITTNQSPKIMNESKIEEIIGKQIISKNKTHLIGNKTKANIRNRQMLNQSRSENSCKTLTNELPKIKRSISLYEDNNVVDKSNNLLNIKSEPLTPLEITPRSGKETNFENKFKNSLKLRNLPFEGNLKKNSPKANFNGDSQNINQKLSADFKISQKSQNSSETIKTAQIISNTKEGKKEAENFKTERNLPSKSQKRRKSCTKSFKETIKTDTKPVKIISNKNKSPSKIQNKKIPTLDENIMKFFDKSLYLDKIKSSNGFSQNNITNLQIPPTPADSTQDPLRKSILPDMYPPHFKYQLPPEAVLNHPLSLPYPQSNVMTPDETVTTELLESSSSSPSLPESLCELLQTKDIKEILNVEKVSYRLYNYHVQALALILNLRVDYLVEILDKIMNMKVEVLKNINEAVKRPFVRDTDLFANTPEDKGENDEMVFSSPSPKLKRFSAMKVEI